MIIFPILGQDQSRSRCPRPHKGWGQVTDSHNLSLFFLRLPPSLYLCPSPGILICLCRLCHSTHSASSSSQGPRSRFNWVPCFVTLGPLRRSTSSAVSARMKWGLNGLSRLCHITCFFTSTIRCRRIFRNQDKSEPVPKYPRIFRNHSDLSSP